MLQELVIYISLTLLSIIPSMGILTLYHIDNIKKLEIAQIISDIKESQSNSILLSYKIIDNNGNLITNRNISVLEIDEIRAIQNKIDNRVLNNWNILSYIFYMKNVNGIMNYFLIEILENNGTKSFNYSIYDKISGEFIERRELIDFDIKNLSDEKYPGKFILSTKNKNIPLFFEGFNKNF